MAEPLEPPYQNENAAPKLLGITGALYVVTLAMYGGRIYTRLRHQRLGWDDYTISAALILAITEWALFLSSVKYGTGRHNYYIPASRQTTAHHLLYASTLLWAPCVMFIKISIACMLIRIKQKRPWQIFFWVMIAIQIASCVANLVFRLVKCIPLSAIWDPTNHPLATCAKPSSALVSLYVESGVAISTDLMFAIIPITLIRNMRRPLHEKIILSLLVGFGVFAAAASVVKTTLIQHYGITGDSLWDVIDPTLWGMLEEHTGIIAACIPCLKSPFERTLNHMGIHSSPEHSRNHSRDQTYEDFGKGDVYHLAKMRPTMRKNKGMGFDTDIFTGNTSIGKSIADRSEETIWPMGEAEELFWQQLAEGGIVKTTELHLESEVLSRAGSMDEREWKDGDGSKGLGGWNVV